MKAYITELVKAGLRQILSEVDQAVVEDLSVALGQPRPGFGDYASSVAMQLFGQLKEKPTASPQDFASALALKCAELDHKQTFAKVEAVAGFLNFTLSQKYFAHLRSEILDRGSVYGASDIGAGQKVILEYFQNNVAKPPHVGHLRSAVIGDALRRILIKVGYQVETDNHVGDWGTQFGILLFAYKDAVKAEGDELVNRVIANPIEELNKLYVSMSARIEAEPELRELGKAEFARLEMGDPENRRLWKNFVLWSYQDFDRYRELLGLPEFTHQFGESEYEADMPVVLQEFEGKGLVTVGETGEKYVDLEADGLGRCILVKSDGASTYHLRDFACYLRRKNELKFDKNLYVVDVRQSHHFRQLFRVLERAGYPAETDSAHINFGFMSLPEGAISTRKGTVISLQNMIDEARDQAFRVLQEKNPDLAATDKTHKVVSQVGLGAIKYFDLSHNRNTELTFTWDKVLNFEGNTGPYLQYTYARLCGMFRKANLTRADIGGWEVPAHDLNEYELAVMRLLQVFPERVEQAALEYLPNVITQYLFDLAQATNSFYQAVPVLTETDENRRQGWLLMLAAVAVVLENGLNLLGIEAPEEM